MALDPNNYLHLVTQGNREDWGERWEVLVKCARGFSEKNGTPFEHYFSAAWKNYKTSRKWADAQRLARERLVDVDDPSFITVEEKYIGTTERSSIFNNLDVAMEALSPEHQEALKLKSEDLTDDEAAFAIGVPVAAFSSRLRRARQRIRRLLRAR